MHYFIFILLILTSCGENKKNSENPSYFSPEEQQNLQVRDQKASLSYIEFQGIDPTQYLPQRIRISAVKLKDFNLNSALIINLSPQVKDYLKKRMEFWEDVSVQLQFNQEILSAFKTTLKTIDYLQTETFNHNNRVEFKLPEKSVSDIWESINPLEFNFLSNTEPAIKVTWELKDKLYTVGDTQHLPLNSTVWFSEFSCHITHHYIYSQTYPNSNKSMPVMGSQKEVRTGSECLNFQDRFMWASTQRTFNFSFAINTQKQKWKLHKRAATKDEKIIFSRKTFVINQIDWFKFKGTWIE